MVKLRKQLTPRQRQLLNEFWQHFTTNGKWPLKRTAHSKRSKQEVRESLRGLGGGIVGEARDSTSGRHHELTIFGGMLTDKSPHYFSLLTRYFEFLRAQFRANPERLDFSSKDLQQTLELSADKIGMLGTLVHRGSFRSSGSSSNDPSWTISVSEEVEDLPEKGSLDQAIQALLLRHYAADRTVFKEDSYRQTPGAPLLDLVPHIDAEVIDERLNRVTVDALTRRYQVFVSSTYEDLKEERQHVIQALLETKCIPTGIWDAQVLTVEHGGLSVWVNGGGEFGVHEGGRNMSRPGTTIAVNLG